MLNVVRTNALFCDKMETSCPKNVAKRSLYKEKDVSLQPCKLNNMNTNRTSKAFIVRAAITLLLLLLTSATAWADEVSYIKADGTIGTATPTKITNSTSLSGGWYIVDDDIDGPLTFTGDVNLILADDADVTIVGDNGIVVNGNLTIYGQSEGTGSLSIKAQGYDNTSGDGIFAQNGQITINGGILSITANRYGIITTNNDITINGGIISVTATGNNNGINASGNITITGGNVIANGVNYGIFAEGTVNLSGGIVTTNNIGNISLSGAIVTASSYSGTVTVQGGVTYTKYDLTTNYTGNIGGSSLNGITLFPTTCFGIASGNEGSQGKPYTITSPEELQLLAIVVNKGNTLTGKYIQVCNNIDMYGIAFRPIGVDSGSKFCGHFDGGGYIISNLNINIDDICIGLFGLVDDNNATIQNITISKATINGDEYVGGIVGSLDYGSIMNCYVINSQITSSNRVHYYGAIVGYSNSKNPLSHNYYGNSIVNEEASDVGCGTADGSSDVPNNDGAVSATILSESENVPSTLSGKVLFYREFTGGSASTICLPFAYTPNGSEGKFYTFKSVEYSEGQYIATMEEANKATSPLSANTPYLFMPAGTGTKPVLFHGDAAYASNPLTTSGYWTFKGTYEEKKWDSEPTGIYGFSAQAVADDNISQGQFVKVGAYVKIRPLRAYLEYTGSNFPNTRSSLPEEGLPDRIIVRLVGGETSIGQLDMKTGQVNFDGVWYNLNGIRLSGKPTKHGIYVHHGKKVVISTMNNE